MKTEDKQFVLLENFEEFRRWTYERLATEIERTRSEHDCLAHSEGVFSDGTVYQVELNVFWDDRAGGDIRVLGDLTTLPQNPDPNQLSWSSDVTDSFIMRRDGTFVGD